MSSSETTDRGHRGLAVWLVGAHLVIGLVLGGITRCLGNGRDQNLIFAVFAGVAFAQSGSAAIWLALSGVSVLLRLMLAATSVGYLAAQFAICVEAPEATVIHVMMFGMAVALVGMPLWAFRCYGIEMCRDRRYGASQATRQFSIRHLMALTFVVACAVAFTRWIEIEVPLRFALKEFFPEILSLTVPFAVVPIAAVWCFLGAKRLWMALVAILMIAIGAALSLRYFVTSETVLFWMTATSVQAVTLALTLGILRYRGYRLRCRRR